MKNVYHDLGSVVDGENNVGDACGGECLDLMQDHRAVSKLDQGLGEREGLEGPSVGLSIAVRLDGCTKLLVGVVGERGGRGSIQEASDGCRNRRRE